MGDHILVTIDGKKIRVPSEIVDDKQLSDFITQNDGGIFVYDGSIMNNEQFARFEKGIKAAVEKIRKEC